MSQKCLSDKKNNSLNGYQPSSKRRCVADTTAVEPPKIALLFLLQEPLQHRARWNVFFEDEARFEYYTHNDHRETRSDRKTGTHEVPTVESGYGDLKAMNPLNSLYTTALKGKASFFILISQQTIPGVSPDEFYDWVLELVVMRPSEFQSILEDKWIGIFQVQNSHRSYLSNFIGEDDEKKKQESAATKFCIPMQKDIDRIIPVLTTSILTRAGAEEFHDMMQNKEFTQLFQTNVHFPGNAKPHVDLNMDIILPCSAPDEGMFMMWCNWRSQDTNTRFIVQVFDEIMYFHIGDDTLSRPAMRNITFKEEGLSCNVLLIRKVHPSANIALFPTRKKLRYNVLRTERRYLRNQRLYIFEVQRAAYGQTCVPLDGYFL
jgi:hypothetical protein